MRIDDAAHQRAPLHRMHHFVSAMGHRVDDAVPRLFVARDRHDVPVDFVRLAKTGPDCEVVPVIGNRNNWGLLVPP